MNEKSIEPILENDVKLKYQRSENYSFDSTMSCMLMRIYFLKKFQQEKKLRKK